MTSSFDFLRKKQRQTLLQKKKEVRMKLIAARWAQCSKRLVSIDSNTEGVSFIYAQGHPSRFQALPRIVKLFLITSKKKESSSK